MRMKRKQMEENHKENCEVAETTFVQAVNKTLILIQISKYLGTLRTLLHKNSRSNRRSRPAAE